MHDVSLCPRGTRDPFAAQRDDAQRGQSLVEFVLILPILLVLLLTVADFGRLFASGITIESAARTAAEVAASEYVREPQPVGNPDGYARLHEYAWRSVCEEARDLPGVTSGGGGECGNVPTVVCVHDGVDPACSESYNDATGIPAGCPRLQPGARPINTQTGGTELSKYVEVRVCYRFETFFQLEIPLFGLNLAPLGGEFFLERVRTFTVVDY